MPISPRVTGAAAAVLLAAGFDAGVVYMPVPRCDTCRWWTTREPDQIRGAIGECMFSKQGGADFYSRTPIMTLAGFGCVQHGAKP